LEQFLLIFPKGEFRKIADGAGTGRSEGSKQEGFELMRERIKIFTFVSGHGETLVDPPHEDRINQWLDAIEGEIIDVTQSESEQRNGGQHVTVCVWYLPTGSTSAEED
jgi:hypothetical protein